MKTLLLAMVMIGGGLYYVRDKPEVPAAVIRGLVNAMQAFNQSISNQSKTPSDEPKALPPQKVEAPRVSRVGNGEFHATTLDQPAQWAHGHPYQYRYPQQVQPSVPEPSRDTPLGKGTFRATGLDRPAEYAGGMSVPYYRYGPYYPPGTVFVQPASGQNTNANTYQPYKQGAVPVSGQ